jgi:hypothetical protein
MARVFYVHWRKDEALATVRGLRAAGHTVRYPTDTGEGAGSRAWKALKASPPEVLVVCLDRLPSHGRRVAAVTRETKRLAELPVVFVGGAPDKVAQARREFPGARFTTAARLAGLLARLDARA